MFKIDNWGIKLSGNFEQEVTLFENTNKVLAVKDGNVIAILWKVPNGLPRIESYNIAIAINEKEHIICLCPKMTLDEILECEARIKEINNT